MTSMNLIAINPHRTEDNDYSQYNWNHLCEEFMEDSP